MERDEGLREDVTFKVEMDGRIYLSKFFWLEYELSPQENWGPGLEGKRKILRGPVYRVTGEFTPDGVWLTKKVREADAGWRGDLIPTGEDHGRH